MRHRATVLVGLLALMLVASTSAPPAAATGVPSRVKMDTAGGVTLTPGEQAAILQGVASAMNFARNQRGWACVSPLTSDDDDLPPLPLNTGVNIDVLIGPDPAGSDGIAILVEVRAVGKRVGSGGRLVVVTDTMLQGDNRERALHDGAVQALEGVLNRLNPCTPKLKAKGKTKVSSAGFSWENEFEGEAQLALDGNGSFSASMPITYSWAPIVVTIPQGTATCSISGNNQGTAELQGEFGDADGALKFNRLALPGISGQLTTTCTAAGETATASLGAPQVPPADAAAQVDIRVALEDGAQRIFPFSSGPITGEITLDLSYEEGEGPGVALGPMMRAD